MKRILALSMALVICISLMSGCAGGSNGSSSTGGKVALKMMGWEASPLETTSVKNGLANFQKQNPNITVEYTTVPGTSYASKLMTMMAGNAAPDVFFCGTDIYKSMAKKGQLLDLTNDFNTSSYKKDDFLPGAWDVMTVNGKVYGVISCIVGPEVFYNKDIFDKAGVAYPPNDPTKAWTWDEFVQTAKKLTVTSGSTVSQYGVYGLETAAMTAAFLGENGCNMFNSDYSKMDIATPEATEVFKDILELRTKYNVAPDAKTLTNIGMTAHQMLETGKVAMIVDGSWSLQELAAMKFKVGMGVLPKFKTCATQVQAHCHAAFAKTKHPTEAWKLVAYLSSDEYQTQNIKEGLWLPNRKSLYTDEGQAKWFTDKIYGEDFKPMIPFFENATVDPFAMLDHNKVNDIYTEYTDKIWNSGADISSTLSAMQTAANTELATPMD